MKILVLIVVVLAASCGKSSSGKLYKIAPEALPRYVNTKSLPVDPNLTLDKSIVNTTYPIQLALYQDGRFYYDLPNLGDGTGTWRAEGGILVLKAKRTLFDMVIEVKANDQAASSVSVQFTDRFGSNTLKMTNLNI